MGWLKKPKIEDTLDSLRLSITYSMDNPYFSALTVGTNVADRKKVLAWTEGAVNFVGGASSAPLPNSKSVEAGIPGIPVLQWDPLGLVGPVYTYDDKGGESWAKARAWNVAEKVVNSFAKLDIDSSVGAMPVRGNLGVQVVKTDQSSNGFSSTTVATWGNPPNGSNKYVIDRQLQLHGRIAKPELGHGSGQQPSVASGHRQDAGTAVHAGSASQCTSGMLVTSE
jgi:iron complex outermembrane receptor protein